MEVYVDSDTEGDEDDGDVDGGEEGDAQDGEYTEDAGDDDDGDVAANTRMMMRMRRTTRRRGLPCRHLPRVACPPTLRPPLRPSPTTTTTTTTTTASTTRPLPPPQQPRRPRRGFGRVSMVALVRAACQGVPMSGLKFRARGPVVRPLCRRVVSVAL